MTHTSSHWKDEFKSFPTVYDTPILSNIGVSYTVGKFLTSALQWKHDAISPGVPGRHENDSRYSYPWSFPHWYCTPFKLKNKCNIWKWKAYSNFFLSSHLFSHFSLSFLTTSPLRRFRGIEHSLRCSAFTWRIYGRPIVTCKRIRSYIDTDMSPDM